MDYFSLRLVLCRITTIIWVALLEFTLLPVTISITALQGLIIIITKGYWRRSSRNNSIYSSSSSKLKFQIVSLDYLSQAILNEPRIFWLKVVIIRIHLTTIILTIIMFQVIQCLTSSTKQSTPPWTHPKWREINRLIAVIITTIQITVSILTITQALLGWLQIHILQHSTVQSPQLLLLRDLKIHF